MQIKGPQAPGKPSASASTPPPIAASAAASAEKMLQGWRIGQILQAVVRPGPPAGTPLLEINGQLLRISSPQTATPTGQAVPAGTPSSTPQAMPAQPLTANPTLQAGQRLQLAVSQTGPNTVLRVLNISTPRIPPEPAILAALPRQLPLTSVLATLQAVTSGIRQTGGASNAPPSPLPDAVLAQSQQILAKLPSPQTITRAEGLQQAIAHSGIFLEAQLAEALRTRVPTMETAQQLSGDLKGGLLSLLSLLLGLSNKSNTAKAPAQNAANTVPPPLANSQPFAQPRLPANTAAHRSTGPQNLPQLLQTLFSQVEGGLARIQLSQLASTSKEDDVQRSWLLDLPLRHGEQIDVLQIRIDEEQREKGKETDSQWTVALAFELGGLGVIHVRVTLISGKINATFWAEEGLTSELFKQHLHELQQRLQAVGLNVGKLASHHGAPPIVDPASNLPYVLLDEEA